MIITLIGMSGSGKTHLSYRLYELGFERISCDDRIEEKLRSDLLKGGYRGINGVARWMGQPYEADYPVRQAAYLSAEREVVREILNGLTSGKRSKVVIDTTGSVIHIGEDLCRALQASSTIVYLETSLPDLEFLYQEYAKNPKPVVWGEAFHRQADETNMAALARCYKEFFHYRRSLYEKYAAVTIPAPLFRQREPNLTAILELVEAQVSGRC